MPDLSKFPEHMTRPPKHMKREDWLKTSEFLEEIYKRDVEDAKRRGEDPSKVAKVGRSTVIRAIEDLDSDRIVGAFFSDGTWWIHRDNVLKFQLLH